MFNVMLFTTDKGFNQAIEGNKEGSTNTGISPGNASYFDWRGFSDSGPSKGGISFPPNSLEVMPETSLGNYIQQQCIIDQGNVY